MANWRAFPPKLASVTFAPFRRVVVVLPEDTELGLLPVIEVVVARDRKSEGDAVDAGRDVVG